MAKEIERKFLLAKDFAPEIGWPIKNAKIKQGYLSQDKIKNVRVRILNDKGFITIKSASKGMTRDEFEYEVPFKDAEFMINNYCSSTISKTRYYIPRQYSDKFWELDVFYGENEGLTVAEIELESEEENFDWPEWVGKEVTDDIRYSSANLVLNPYKNWK